MEKWKPIFKNINYEISNYGRFRNKKGKILKLNTNARGYLYCNICTNGIVTKVKIHKLVAEAFVVNKENKDTVNHIDGNKLNNNSNNLEWLTRKENIQHAFKNKLMGKNKKII